MNLRQGISAKRKERIFHTLNTCKHCSKKCQKINEKLMCKVTIIWSRECLVSHLYQHLSKTHQILWYYQKTSQLTLLALHHVMTCFANLKMGFRANNIEPSSCSYAVQCFIHISTLRSYFAINVEAHKHMPAKQPCATFFHNFG